MKTDELPVPFRMVWDVAMALMARNGGTLNEAWDQAAWQVVDFLRREDFSPPTDFNAVEVGTRIGDRHNANVVDRSLAVTAWQGAEPEMDVMMKVVLERELVTSRVQ